MLHENAVRTDFGCNACLDTNAPRAARDFDAVRILDAKGIRWFGMDPQSVLRRERIQPRIVCRAGVSEECVAAKHKSKLALRHLRGRVIDGERVVSCFLQTPREKLDLT